MRSLIIRLFMLGLFFPALASAALVKGDFLTPGDGFLITDTSTHLEWLTPYYTKGNAYNDATVQALINTYGFRYATASETLNMINTNFNNPVGSPGNAAGYTSAENFLNTFGVNAYINCGGSPCPRTQGRTSDLGVPADTHLAFGMIQIGSNGYLISNNVWSDSSTDTQMGSWLVRSNPVVPDAPTIGTATAGNAQATVSFTAPGSDGGSAITGYTATCGGTSNTGASSPITVTGLTNGTAYTCTVTATNAVGAGAASAASNSVTPATVPGAPTIGTATGGNAQATVTFTAPVSNGGSAITGYTADCGGITNTGAASPITVTGLTNGTSYTCTVTATNAVGTGAASVASNSVTPLGSQIIGFGAAPSVIVGGTGTVSATGGASGNAVTFTSTTLGVCTISGSTVTGVAAGTCTIAADQAGNANYNAASQVTQNITIGAASQPISFGAAPGVIVGGTGTVSATGGASGNAVTFSSTTPSVCTVSGSTVTGVTAGTCTIAADQAGNANYNAAPQVTQNITIGKANQTISFGAAPSVIVGGTGTVSATATSGLAVSFTAITATCNFSGVSTVGGVTVGTCTITADQAGNANYNAAPQVTQNITIGQGSQTITFGATPSVIVGGTGTVSATGGASGNAVTFTSTTLGICTISGSTVTGVTVGTCTIAANQAGNANYNAATQATQNITIGAASQSISFGAAPSVVVGGTGSVSATATSGLAVSFTSTTTGVCTVSGSTVTGVTAGTCTIAANQAGNANYNAASQVTQNITVTSAPVSGACGSANGVAASSAPSSNLCTAGSASAVAGSGPWTWTCNGSNGGINASCSAPVVTVVDAPTCTLAATPASITAGGTSLLTASCSPAAASYSWSSNAGFGSTVTSGTVSPSVTTTYSVTGSNDGGSGNTTSATVTVTPISYLLSVTKSSIGSNGLGAVTSSPAGINCGSTCSSSFTSGTPVTLAATPASGSIFAGWSGGCTGTGSCVVTMNAAKAVTATFKPKSLDAETHSNITGTSATVSTTIAFKGEDVGKPGAVYITAWVPVRGLGALGISTANVNRGMRVTSASNNPYLSGGANSQQVALEAILAASDPDAFVLIQLTPSGWQLVENGQLIPASSGVLGDSLAYMSILNNADPANLLGAQFCVGYGTSLADINSATEMIGAGRMQSVLTIPDPNSTVTSSGSCNVAAAQYTGLWWNPNESGWGMNVTQHGSIVANAMYTYDQNGQPTWYTMACPLTGVSCTGDIYRVSGGTPPTVPWNGSGKVVGSAGSGTLTFTDVDNGTFTYTIDNVAGSKSITKFLFATGTTLPTVDYTDLWWNSNENGWGVALTQQYGVVSAAWYSYDSTGKAFWYVASCPVSGSDCAGDLYQVTGGSPLSGVWHGTNPSNKAGTISFAFTDASHGTMSYTINGVPGSRIITRF